MAAIGTVIIGVVERPLRGVLIEVEGVRVIISPNVARSLAAMLTSSADELDATGGASPGVADDSRMLGDDELREVARLSGLTIGEKS